MDSKDLRERLEMLLDITESFLKGKNYSEDDLQAFEAACEGIREELKIERRAPEEFPGNQWVFRVRRTQFVRVGVSAETYEKAYDLAAAQLHANVEALRFTWDLSNPLDLSPIELEREPHGR